MTIIAGIVGCGEGSHPEDKKVETVQTEIETLGKAAKAAGGDFEKLSQSDKDKFMARVNRNQAAASEMVKRMAGTGGARGAGSK